MTMSVYDQEVNIWTWRTFLLQSGYFFSRAHTADSPAVLTWTQPQHFTRTIKQPPFRHRKIAHHFRQIE